MKRFLSLLCVYLTLYLSVFAEDIKLGENTWSSEIPDTAISSITAEGSSIQMSVNSATNLWNTRAAVPMLKLKAPEGNFAVQALVEYPSDKVSAVAGLSVYAGGVKEIPSFTFGLDLWDGGSRLKFQGLPPNANSPSVSIEKKGLTRAWLRLECYQKKFTHRPSNYYVALYKTEECQAWQKVYKGQNDGANNYICLFLKTAAAQNVKFSAVEVLPLPADSYLMDPPKLTPQVKDIPILKGKKLLFTVRSQYKSDHHNTATLFQTGEINTDSFRGGSALRYIDFAQDGKVVTLIELPDGVIRDPEVSYDGKRILFSMRKNKKDDYHIYEMNADGSGLRQITYGSGLSDIDPVYLPDGRIAFCSTREPKYCMCNRHIMCNIFTMDSDGANIQQIGHSTLFEGHLAVLPDGRLLYDRWEYVDRDFGDAQGLWVTNPDGTNHAIYYGNNMNAPGGVLEGRPICGTNYVICTFSSCHDRPWGAIAILDRSKGVDGKDAVVRTWPESARDLVNVGNYDTFKNVTPKYEDPYSITSEDFLCSRQIQGQKEKMGLVYFNLAGQEVQIYAEPDGSHLGCYDPQIIEARETPRIIQSRIDLSKKSGTFYVSDVYNGTGMENIAQGTVKWLRVVESPEKRFWTHTCYMGAGTGTQAPGMAWNDFNNKRILGTVPVEEDGSANFEVPADTFVYFQLLDEEGRMVQSMRSGTIVRPGENQGCIGCHEDRLNAVAPRHTVKALMRPADKLNPWYGEPRLFSYTAEVQPVFNKNCIKCHDVDGPGAKAVCLAGDLSLLFNNSYTELRKNRRFVKVVGAGPWQVQNPRTWGSYVSRLADVVLHGHGVPERDAQLHLTQEEKDRVVTWIDINAPYYSDYSSSYPTHLFGRSPLNATELKKLTDLTGVKFGDKTANLVWFDRPEKSPLLAKMKKESPEYKKALEIIYAGKAYMKEIPRNDMPGFKLTAENEIRIEQKYQKRLTEERERIKATVDGRKIYDQDLKE